MHVGSSGDAATRYKIMQRTEGTGEYAPSARLVVRGTLIIACDAATVDRIESYRCIKLAGVTYGANNAPDTCGFLYCVPSMVGFTIYIR
jgi:hypothetical protein